MIVRRIGGNIDVLFDVSRLDGIGLSGIWIESRIDNLSIPSFFLQVPTHHYHLQS